MAIPNLPLKDPLVDEERRVTRRWALLFERLWPAAVGSPSNPPPTEPGGGGSDPADIQPVTSLIDIEQITETDPQTKQQIERVRVSFTTPAWADLTGVLRWYRNPYTATEAVDHGEDVASPATPGSTTYFRIPRGETQTQADLFIGTRSASLKAKFDPALPSVRVTIPAIGMPAQPTGFSVTLVSRPSTAPVPGGHFKLAWTDAADPNRKDYVIERRRMQDAAFSAPVAGAAGLYATHGQDIQTVPYEQSTEGDFDYPPVVEYWQYRIRARNNAGQTNDANPPTSNVVVPSNVGLNAGAINPVSLAAQLQVASGLLGVKAKGIAEANLADAAASTRTLVDLNVTNSKYANGSIDYLKVGTTAIQNAHLDKATANKVMIGSANIISVAANQIDVGILNVGVQYAGTVNASQVNSGAFSGCSLTLNFNGITTTVDNGIYGGIAAGFKCQHNTSGRYARVSYSGIACHASNTYFNAVTAQLYDNDGYGVLLLGNNTYGSSAVQITALGGSPSISFNGYQVLGTRRTGWSLPSGTFSRASFDANFATTLEVATRLHALIIDLWNMGIIGA